MTPKLPILKVAGPTLVVSLILLAACTVSAYMLYRLHARTAESLALDVESRKVAADIENTVRNLIALTQRGSEQVEVLHEKLWNLLAQARDLVNTEKDKSLQNDLELSLERYHDLWHRRGGEASGALPDPAKQALVVLQKETLPKAIELRSYDQAAIYKSEEALRGTVKWMAWALVAVGSIGSLGGILFGYSVARALRKSIYKLSVSVRDAADKLREDLPAVTLSTGDGIDHLHEQMRDLARDIGEMVERLQQRDRELLHAEQLAAVGQLAAGVAHELRNPLTAVKMLVQTSREDMEQRGLPAEDLGIIEQEIRRLERSLQTFLDFARPPRMERRSIDLGEVIEEALALVGGRARKQHVSVEFVPPETSVHLEADGEQLRQLMVNLAMNALDAMPEGGKLSVEVDQARDDLVELRVKDTGQGIPTELIPRLFEPFASGKETGLGLGLVVSRRIAEAHEGTLTVEPAVAGGACFLLRLPARPREPMANAIMSAERM